MNASERRQFVLLAPVDAEVPSDLGHATVDRSQHANLLAELQRFRGRIYADDGSIDRSLLTADGRHVQAIDHNSWHIVILGANGEVAGCARYSPHRETVSFDELGPAHSPLVHSDSFRLRCAIFEEIATAVRKNVAFAEAGGWALAPEIRCSTAAVDIVLLTFALAERLGGCIGITTAARLRGSASILQRIGGQRIAFQGEELPAYYDPQYHCEIELLRFDSANSNPRFGNRLRSLNAQLSNIEILYTHQATPQVAYAAAA